MHSRSPMSIPYKTSFISSLWSEYREESKGLLCSTAILSASLSLAFSLAYDSRHPWFPPSHKGPETLTTICPTSPSPTMEPKWFFNENTRGHFIPVPAYIYAAWSAPMNTELLKRLAPYTLAQVLFTTVIRPLYPVALLTSSFVFLPFHLNLGCIAKTPFFESTIPGRQKPKPVMSFQVIPLSSKRTKAKLQASSKEPS